MRATLSILLIIVPSFAFAANNRSAVSLNGSDMNPCTTTQPCRSFTAAMAVTNAGGEIIALDSAGYGAFTINQAVTVSGAPGVHAAITATSGDAIYISAASAYVAIRNLVLIGGGATGGIDVGVVGVLDVSDVAISGFSSIGILSFGGALIANRCWITGTTATAGTAIVVLNAHATVSNSQISGNNNGIDVEDNSSAAIAHCVIADNTFGVLATNLHNGAPAEALVDGCSIVANGTGVSAGGFSVGISLLRLSDNAIFGNGTGLQNNMGGTIDTYGNNKINGNGLDYGAGTTLTPITLH